MARRSASKVKRGRGRPRAADEIIRGLTGLRDALADGAELPHRFTMRTVAPSLELVAGEESHRPGRR